MEKLYTPLLLIGSNLFMTYAWYGHLKDQKNSALWELAEEFRAYAIRNGQVFVSTHSPDFLNAAKIDEVFWLGRRAH